MPSFKKNKKSVVLVKTERTPGESHPPADIPPAPLESPSSTEAEGTVGTISVERAPSKNALRYEAAGQIWKTLGETTHTARVQILRIVDKLGHDESLTLLAETQAIEASGGMMLVDGSRRRTAGGVFFQLARTKYPDLFPHWGKSETKPASVAVPSPMPLPEIALDPEQKGTIMKLTLLGRPASRIEDKGTFVTFVMQSNKVPTLPKGLPALDSTIKTNYVVYIAAKQWRKVAQAIADPEDILIIEGFPQLNSKNGSVSVFAISVTTKFLQRANKEMQREQAQEEPQNNA